MTVSKQTIVTLQRKVSREIELQSGLRQSYNRRSKKAYDRRKEKRVEFTY